MTRSMWKALGIFVVCIAVGLVWGSWWPLFGALGGFAVGFAIAMFTDLFDHEEAM